MKVIVRRGMLSLLITLAGIILCRTVVTEPGANGLETAAPYNRCSRSSLPHPHPTPTRRRVPPIVVFQDSKTKED